MIIEYDNAKNLKNINIRGLSFDLAREFDIDTALIWQDERFEYEELRFIALGYIQYRLYSLVFTPRGDILRVISLRKANSREGKRYEKYLNT